MLAQRHRHTPVKANRVFQAARYSPSRLHRLVQPWNSRNLARQQLDHSLEEVYLLRPLPSRSALASPSIQLLHHQFNNLRPHLWHQPPTLSHHPPLHPPPNNNNNRLSPLLNNLSLPLPSRILSSLPQLPSSNRRTLHPSSSSQVLNQLPLRATEVINKMDVYLIL